MYQLDEPSLVSPAAVDGLPAFTGRLMDGLGFRYLLLRRFAEQQGELSVESPSAAPTSASEDLSEAATR